MQCRRQNNIKPGAVPGSVFILAPMKADSGTEAQTRGYLSNIVIKKLLSTCIEAYIDFQTLIKETVVKGNL